MNVKKYILLFSFVFLANLAAQSQNINYYGWFPTIDLSGKLTNRFSYNLYLFDAIKFYSNNNNQDKAKSFYLYGEAGLSYNLSSKLSFTAAYVHERQNPFLTNFRSENRFFQQATLKLPIGKAELKQRLRFDERFIQNRSTGETPFTHRLRYLIGIKRPIVAEKLYFMAYSEAFFNTSNSFQFNENWSAMQLGVHLNRKNSLEMGLLYVGWINNAANDWLHQYYLQTTWVLQLDFSKK